jgi:hypothetical protein
VSVSTITGRFASLQISHSKELALFSKVQAVQVHIEILGWLVSVSVSISISILFIDLFYFMERKLMNHVTKHEFAQDV